MSTKDDEVEGSPSTKKAFFNFNLSSSIKKVKKVGQRLNLVSLSKKNDGVNDDDVDISFDYPNTESFIGENPLAANRESEYRYTEYAEDDDDEEEVCQL